ncbi:MAG: right-handed parallel beta-helix repeat-containing protein [Bacteroidia bacterium]|nr:right-handed parallel beta-helix repeat-containing protein [Bacteroidia bacterium]
MKKILIFLFLLIFTVATFAESGDGSSGNPFWGTISSSVQWSVGNPYYGSTVYIGTSSNPDLTVGSGGHLTIDPGITVILTQLTSDLFITGTGQLTAGGTGSQVTFTKDPAKSHWGHISFQSMSGSPASSTFNNCVFEYGYSTGTSAQPLLAGGAIQIDFNGVVITNCVFRNNYAYYAGAVMVNSNRNTIIRKSYFKSNNVYECGGAMILYTGSTALIENCIFESNYSKGNSSALYSGGAIWSYINTSKVVNCTFVENTSDRAGDAIYSYSSSGMRIINSILWGSNDQFAGATTTSTIVTCAFESAKPANAANSIIISDVASDHFVNAGSSDWTLKFISPCRDAGSTPSPTVPNDYIGNPRIGNYDIGAYEVHYSRWTGATNDNWLVATNWEQSVDPGTGTGDVIIPSGLTNYPTVLPAKNFTLGSGKIMIIKPGAKTTLGTLTNNGTLKLESDAGSIASLIVTTYNDSGNEEIELYLTGGGSPSYKWHYISTPVSTLPVNTFTGVTYDIAGYFEARVTIDLLQGWIGYDGWIYASENPAYDYDYDFTDLVPGRGYDFYDAADNKFTFSGTLNTSDVSTTVTFLPGGDAGLNGFNLLGNPFSSGLDWDIIAGDAGYPANTSKSIYFTRDNSLCSYINHVGVPGDVSGIIPPMQGFFTKTYVEDHTITLATAARTHGSIHARYKGKSDIPLVRLSLSEETLSDETVVRFDESAKTYLDNDFDAIKMFTSPDNLLIYSAISGIKYVINGQPFPDTLVEIPIVVNLKQEGTHTITTTQLQGLDNYHVYLKDNTTGFSANLKTAPVLTFSASPGLITDRFILKVVNVLTGTEDPIVASKSFFNIYQAKNMINIQTVSDEWDGKRGSVRVLDLTGPG